MVTLKPVAGNPSFAIVNAAEVNRPPLATVIRPLVPSVIACELLHTESNPETRAVRYRPKPNGKIFVTHNVPLFTTKELVPSAFV